MILYDANVPGPNPTVVRLFILERGGLHFDVVPVNLAELENRGRAYRETINARGELPALRLDDGRVVTEITAICEFLDEVANGGRSLVGSTPEERALTRMWTRRVDLEICEPVVSWWRGTDDAEAVYRGSRILAPEAKRYHRLLADRGLNQLDEDLEGRDFLCGNQIMLADIVLYGFLATLGTVVAWVNNPARRRVAAWIDRMSKRTAAVAMLAPFPATLGA